MSASIANNERLVELLAQRATDGLSAAEQAELNGLLARRDYSDTEQFDETAAALLIAGIDTEPLPDSLKLKLQQQVDDFSASAVNQFAPLQQRPAARSKSASAGIAWLAAAACAVLAIAGWWPRLQGDLDGRTQTAADEETVAQARERLLAQPSVLRREWKPTEDPAARGVTGDIVWDEQAQVGYMRFRGLPTNDPQELQYQLWIFDATRGDQYPVDGGVFDIPATPTGEVVVPILAKLPVRDPAMFAVTIEKPGGAVVSARERIVVVAPAG